MLEEIKVPLLRSGKEILVTLLKGGEDFPWAEIDGRVVIGPLKSNTFKGFPTWMFDWHKNLYWVFEAEDHKGASTELTPREYEKAVLIAENLALAVRRAA